MYNIDTYWPRRLIFFVYPHTMTFFRDLACRCDFLFYTIWCTSMIRLSVPTWYICKAEVTDGLSHGNPSAKIAPTANHNATGKTRDLDNNKMKRKERQSFE